MANRGSWILAFILGCVLNQNVLADSEFFSGGKVCVTMLKLHPMMTCQLVAELCHVSIDTLYRLNPYFQNGAVCKGPLAEGQPVCCDYRSMSKTDIALPDLMKWPELPTQSHPCRDDCRPEISDPVCGSDGVTYPNLCFLEAESCRNPGKQLYPVANTACRHDEWKKCHEVCSSEARPVCASDNTTYINECYLRSAACKLPNQNLFKVSDGNCVNEYRNPQSSELAFVAGLGLGTALGSGIKTGCFTVLGEQCKFPFVYKGVHFDRCTTDGFPFPWCATKRDYSHGMVKWCKCAIGPDC